MMRVFSLFLPALIPSWRFFDGIAPSPRIEVAQIDDPAQEVERWVEFNPRPQRVTFGQMLMRLVWNPHWNEQLFLVSCSERLRDNPTQHSLDQIQACLNRDLPDAQYLIFRVVFVSLEDGQLTKDILYTSPIEPLA